MYRSRIVRGLRELLGALALTLSVGGSSVAHAAGATSDWPYFGGSKRFDRYSALSQINAANVAGLRPGEGLCRVNRGAAG